MKANNFKITLTGKEIKKLLRDKLKRTINYNSKLYKCKIFKKCKKIICNMKTKHKCDLKKKRDRTISNRNKLHKNKRKRRRLMKIKSGRQNSISTTTKHSLFKGSFLNFSWKIALSIMMRVHMISHFWDLSFRFSSIIYHYFWGCWKPLVHTESTHPLLPGKTPTDHIGPGLQWCGYS